MIAAELGWSVVLGSGSRDTYPGDVISNDWIGECKTHDSSGHKIVFYQNVWAKIKEEAASKFKYPVLFVDDGSQKSDYTWCMFPSHIMKPDVQVVDFPYKFKTNINFYSEDLHIHMRLCGSDMKICYKADFVIDNVYITDLKTFREMFCS